MFVIYQQKSSCGYNISCICNINRYPRQCDGPSWSWSHGSYRMFYNYLGNQYLWPLVLKLWVRTPFRRSALDTTLCDEICQWLATGRWFSLGPTVSSTNKTDHHDISEILLKVALNTINHPCAYEICMYQKVNLLWIYLI